MNKLIILLFALTGSLAAGAQQQVTTLKPTRLAIFKNGSYFVRNEAVVNPRNRQFLITPPETALHGTFWLAVGRNTGLRSVSFAMDTLRIARSIQSMVELLEHNIGKTVTIRRRPYNNSPNPREYQGTLMSVSGREKLVKLRTNDGRMVFFEPDDIEEVLTDAGINDKYMVDSLARLARVSIDRDADRVEVSTISMQLGINWYPSYQFRVINDKEARLDMKATIENLGEAIRQAEIDLVVGNPNMFFGKALDPICRDFISQSLMNEGSLISANRMQSLNFANGVSASPRFDWNDDPYSPAGNQGLAGEKSQDLYYYKAGKLDLDRRSKVLTPIFSQTVGYKDIYEIDVPHTVLSDYSRSSSGQSQSPLEVYHSFRLTNSTRMPFTSGPVFVLDEKENPLAQDELKYVPMGAEGMIRLSKAIDVQAKNEEEVLDILMNFRKFNKDYYNKASLKGEIRLANYQEKKINITVTKTVLGEVYLAGDNGKITRLKGNGSALNPTTSIRWEIELNPGEQRTLTYSYGLLVN